MAEAAVQSPTSSSSLKYFCHKCSVSVDLSPELPDLTCPRCESGFIEEMTQDLQDQHAARAERPPSHTLFGDREEMPNFLSNLLFSSVHGDPGDHDADDDENDTDDDDEYFHLPTRYGGGGHDRRALHRRRMRARSPHSPSDESRTAFPRFLEDLFRELTGGSSGRMPGLFPLLPPLFHGDPRDYAWGADGLDNAITQLLNQWECPGSPPASTDDIDRLRSLDVTQEHLDKEAQCSVCMEDFALSETVLSLPCQHIFHSDCIKPWLQLHNTCPICRQTLGNGATSTDNCRSARAADPPPPQLSDMSTTDSSDSSYETTDDDNDEGRLGAAAARTATVAEAVRRRRTAACNGATSAVGRTSDGEEKKDVDKPMDDDKDGVGEDDKKVGDRGGAIGRLFNRHRFQVMRRRGRFAVNLSSSSSSSDEENYDTA